MPHCQGRDGGSDGSQFREYKLPTAAYFPVECPVTLRQPPQHQPQIDPALWPAIAKRARRESLRALALEYGVSHEAIRRIVRRVASTQGAEAARARLAPSAECWSRAVDRSRRLAAGSSQGLNAPPACSNRARALACLRRPAGHSRATAG